MKRVTKTLVGVEELISFGATVLNKTSKEIEQILEDDWIFPDGIEFRECDYGKMEFEFNSKNWSENTKQIMFGFLEKNNIKKFTLSCDE